MQVSTRRAPGPLNLLVDSTGIKFLGDGEWLARKHGPQRRRQYRKVHLAMDTATGDIRAVEFTSSDKGDSPILPHLLDQIPPDEPIDTVTSSGGDTIYGGAGRDSLDFSVSTSSVSVDLVANQHSSFLAGTLIYEVENILAGSGNDTLRGTTGANLINGGAGNDLIIATLGGDTIIGGAGNDTVSYENASSGVLADLANPSANSGVATGDTYTAVENLSGTASDDTLRGGHTGNTLRAGDGNDRLDGRDGDDLLAGENGNDVLRGDAGNDTLNGGSGNDTLTGGTGADTFIFRKGFGRDVITDFESNTDTISLAGFGISSFAQARTSATREGNDVIFDFGGGDVLTVKNITIAALEDDLTFGI